QTCALPISEEPAGHADLRAGGPGARGEAVHEDHLAGPGGAVNMASVDIKKDVEVRVINGKDRGRTGRVVHVLTREGKVMVEGVAGARSQQRTSGKRCRCGSLLQQGGISECVLFVGFSNVHLVL